MDTPPDAVAGRKLWTPPGLYPVFIIIDPLMERREHHSDVPGTRAKLRLDILDVFPDMAWQEYVTFFILCSMHEKALS